MFNKAAQHDRRRSAGSALLWTIVWLAGISGLVVFSVDRYVPLIEAKLTEDVVASLDLSADRSVEVAVRGHQAVLSGSVHDAQQKRALLDAALATPGIFSVSDELSLQATDSTQGSDSPTAVADNSDPETISGAGMDSDPKASSKATNDTESDREDAPPTTTAAANDTDERSPGEGDQQAADVDDASAEDTSVASAESGSDTRTPSEESISADADADKVALAPGTDDTAAAELPEVRASIPPAMTLQIRDGTLSMNGRMAAGDDIEALLGTARDAFEIEAVSNSIASDEEIASANWLEPIVSLLPALALLEQPGLEISNDEIVLSGMARDEATYDAVVNEALQTLVDFTLVEDIDVAQPSDNPDEPTDVDPELPSELDTPSTDTSTVAEEALTDNALTEEALTEEGLTDGERAEEDLTEQALADTGRAEGDATAEALTDGELAQEDATAEALTDGELAQEDATAEPLTDGELAQEDATEEDLTDGELAQEDVTEEPLTDGVLTDESPADEGLATVEPQTEPTTEVAGADLALDADVDPAPDELEAPVESDDLSQAEREALAIAELEAQAALEREARIESDSPEMDLDGVDTFEGESALGATEVEPLARIDSPAPLGDNSSLDERRAALAQAMDELESTRILFRSGQDVLTARSIAILDEIADVLIRFPDVPVGIDGHTDAAGDQQANLLLSQRRANAVRDYLVESGVSVFRLTARGFGEEVPLVSNATRRGRAANRRIEFNY